MFQKIEHEQFGMVNSRTTWMLEEWNFKPLLKFCWTATVYSSQNVLQLAWRNGGGGQAAIRQG